MMQFLGTICLVWGAFTAAFAVDIIKEKASPNQVINLNLGELWSTGAKLMKIWNLVGNKLIRTNPKGHIDSYNSLQRASVCLKTYFLKLPN